MADEAIIAVFKADIEQFKAQMAELGVKVGAVETKIQDTSDSTQKFATHSKTAAGSIKTLSQGLGGITGLLGITGRLFGVNTDKLQALIFSSREFIKVARDITHAQHLSNLATEKGTVAKVANESATVSLTVAERVLNAVRSAGALGIGLIITGITALAAIIIDYVGGLKEEEKQLKRNQELNRAQIKLNNDLTESFNKRNQTEEERILADAVSAGKITERQAKEIALKRRNDEAITAIDKKVEQERIDAMKQGVDQFGRIKASEEAIIQANRTKRLQSQEASFQQGMLDIDTEFTIKGRDAKKKADEAAIAENKKFFDDLSKSTKAGLKQVANDEIKETENNFKEGDKAIAKVIDDGEADRNGRLRRWFKDRVAASENEKKEELRSEEEVAKEAEKRRQERLDQVKQGLDAVFNAQQEAFDKRQELLNKEVDSQQKAIDQQRSLAERGLDNTLAFEEKRAADLQRQQQKEAAQQKKVKLLETFLNSLAQFEKEDPKTAIQKALLQVALATAATAVFAEEGGIIGEITQRSFRGGRKHRGGGDVLLHAQTGEGILSRREMDNLGKRNFHLLKDAARFPIRDDVFAMPKIAMAGGMAMSNEEVVKELKALRHDIKNQKRESWEVNKFGEYIKTSIENGVTEVIKGKMPKPRFRG